MSISALGPAYLFTHDAPLSTKRKVVRAILYFTASGLSIFVSEPSVRASFSLKGNKLEETFIRTSGVICGFDWATLGAYGACMFINGQLHDKSREEEALFKPTFGRAGRIAAGIVSFIFGLGQRLPTIPEALRFNKDHPDFARVMAGTSIFVESWLPSYAMLLTIEKVFNRRLFEKKLHVAKLALIDWTKETRNKAIRMNDTEMACHLSHLLTPSKIEDVAYDVWFNGKEAAPSKLKKCVNITSYALGGVVVSSMVGLFILDALLTKNLVNYFSHNGGLVALGIFLTLFPMLFGGPFIGYQGVRESVNMLADQRETYGEYVYPILSKVLKITALLFAFAQYTEEKALVKLYLKPGLPNDLLTYSNTVSCGFMIAKSYYTLIEAFLYLLAYATNNDFKHYAIIKERCDRFERLLTESTPAQMLELLNACDAQVKRDTFNQGERTFLIQA